MFRVAVRSARLFVRSVIATAMTVAIAGSASAQTTVTISQPGTDVWSATVRGGSYANRNLSTIMETRSSTNYEYLRRTLLKFDTQNNIPAGANVTSAIMTVTVKQGSDDATRRIGVYQVTTSWEEPEVTFNRRKTSASWGRPGGDLGTKITEKVVSNVAGTQVSFDITPLVQQAVRGQLGSSRYTRIALVDMDGSTNESWRAYYTENETTTSRRPTLRVTYGGSTSTPPPTGASTGSTTTTGSRLRVLSWNIGKNGWGTDGRYDPNRVADWVVKMNPDVIAFQELERWNSYSQGEDGLAVYKSLLEKKTGRTWYVYGIQAYGNWDDKGLISAIFSKTPFKATFRRAFSAGKLKSAGGATITVNGRNINVLTTHFDPYTASYRAIQAKDLNSFANGYTQDMILAGDFNEQATNPPMVTIWKQFYDGWAEGKKKGIAYSASDNPNGYTRNSRIDYLTYSRRETHLTMTKITVVDTRNSSGVMPSDHRPILAEFTVN